MGAEIRLCDGLEEYPKATIVKGNLVMAVWIGLGTVACYFFNHTVAWVFLAIAIIMVFVVLRGLVCVNCCYYGKWCPTGWGKLSALMFKQGRVERFNDSIGIKLAPATYGLLTLAPLVFGTISAVKDFSAIKVVVLVCLLLVGFYSGAISRKATCAQCKMREFCRGSAARPVEQAGG